MKIKTNSTERLDRRYLLIENGSKEEIEKAIAKLSGAMGLAQTAPTIVEDFKEHDKKQIILAVNRDSIDLVRAAFELSDGKIKIIRVSGTIKGLKR